MSTVKEFLAGIKQKEQEAAQKRAAKQEWARQEFENAATRLANETLGKFAEELRPHMTVKIGEPNDDGWPRMAIMIIDAPDLPALAMKIHPASKALSRTAADLNLEWMGRTVVEVYAGEWLIDNGNGDNRSLPRVDSIEEALVAAAQFFPTYLENMTKATQDAMNDAMRKTRQKVESVLNQYESMRPGIDAWEDAWAQMEAIDPAEAKKYRRWQIDKAHDAALEEEAERYRAALAQEIAAWWKKAEPAAEAINTALLALKEREAARQYKTVSISYGMATTNEDGDIINDRETCVCLGRYPDADGYWSVIESGRKLVRRRIYHIVTEDAPELRTVESAGWMNGRATISLMAPMGADYAHRLAWYEIPCAPDRVEMVQAEASDIVAAHPLPPAPEIDLDALPKPWNFVDSVIGAPEEAGLDF